MAINITEDNLKSGVLGLVLALVEVIRDALKIQALKRMESGGLSEAECERLGKALMELDVALEQIKEEQGIAESVRSVRDGLDEIVDDVINRLVNPGSWAQEYCDRGGGETAGLVAGVGGARKDRLGD
ncbi:MAG: gas vesicle protein K [Chloroflexi bacterium]|nr:gas vesicle protein K [Chloroflexota bacterium]